MSDDISGEREVEGEVSEDLIALFDVLRPFVSDRLLDDRGWELILDRIGDLPGWPTVSQGPLLEFRLADPEPAADVFVAMNCRGALADHYAAAGAGADEGSFEAAWGSFVARTAASDDGWPTSALLEYDIVEVDPPQRRAPGVFLDVTALSPSERDARSAGRLADIVATAAGLPSDSCQRKHYEQMFAAMPDSAEVIWIGAMPGREPRPVGSLVQGLGPGEMLEYLRRLGWNAPVTTFRPALEELFERLPVSALQVAVTSDGVLPRVGFEFYPELGRDETPPWMGATSSDWQPAIERLEHMGLCLHEKAVGLLALTGTTRLYDSRGVFAAIRGINNLKIVVEGSRVEAKAYAGVCLVRL